MKHASSGTRNGKQWEPLMHIMDQIKILCARYGLRVALDLFEVKGSEDDVPASNTTVNKAGILDGVAFIATVQLFLYSLIRDALVNKNNPSLAEIPPLSETNGSPQTIQAYLDRIPTNFGFDAVYNIRIFDLFHKDAKGDLALILAMLAKFFVTPNIQGDFMGLLFQELMPFQLRKKLAAYYSRPLAAELLVKLTLDPATFSGEETVFDPACGSGLILVKAYDQKQRLLGTKFNQKKAIQTLFGIDISAIAVILSQLNLAVKNPAEIEGKVQVQNEDAFNFHPELKFDVVAANPPFTRGSRFSEKEKNTFQKYVQDRLGIKIGFKSWNLYAFFMIRIPEFVREKKGSRIGLILPYAAIAAEYIERVWHYLFEKTDFGIVYIVNASQIDKSFSESGDQEIIVVLERGFRAPAKLIQLKQPLPEYNMDVLIQCITELPAEEKATYNTPLYEGMAITQEYLQATGSRQWKFKRFSILADIQTRFIPINEYGFIKPGSESGMKPVDYFYLPNRYWDIQSENEQEITFQPTEESLRIIDEQQKSGGKQKAAALPKISQKISISKAYLSKSLPRTLAELEDQPPFLVSGYPHIWYLKYRLIEKEAPDHPYVLWGQYIQRIVNNFVPFPSRPARIFILYRIDLASTKTIAIHSPDAVESTALSRCIFIPKEFTAEADTLTELLFAYLTSSLFLLDFIEKSRMAAGTMIKLYKTDIFLYRFPDLRLLGPERREELIRLSRIHNGEISIKTRPTLLERVKKASKNREDPLRFLDEAWLRALNFDPNRLQELYSAIHNYLQ